METNAIRNVVCNHNHFNVCTPPHSASCACLFNCACVPISKSTGAVYSKIPLLIISKYHQYKLQRVMTTLSASGISVVIIDCKWPGVHMAANVYATLCF